MASLYRSAFLLNLESRELKKVKYREKFVIAKFVIKYLPRERALAKEGNSEKVRSTGRFDIETFDCTSILFILYLNETVYCRSPQRQGMRSFI